MIGPASRETAASGFLLLAREPVIGDHLLIFALGGAFVACVEAGADSAKKQDRNQRQNNPAGPTHFDLHWPAVYVAEMAASAQVL